MAPWRQLIGFLSLNQAHNLLTWPKMDLNPKYSKPKKTKSIRLMAKISNIGVEIFAGLGSESTKNPRIDKAIETTKR
jgi:hypothetical protein